MTKDMIEEMKKARNLSTGEDMNFPPVTEADFNDPELEKNNPYDHVNPIEQAAMDRQDHFIHRMEMEHPREEIDFTTYDDEYEYNLMRQEEQYPDLNLDNPELDPEVVNPDEPEQYRHDEEPTDPFAIDLDQLPAVGGKEHSDD